MRLVCSEEMFRTARVPAHDNATPRYHILGASRRHAPLPPSIRVRQRARQIKANMAVDVSCWVVEAAHSNWRLYKRPETLVNGICGGFLERELSASVGGPKKACQLQCLWISRYNEVPREGSGNLNRSMTQQNLTALQQ